MKKIKYFLFNIKAMFTERSIGSDPQAEQDAYWYEQIAQMRDRAGVIMKKIPMWAWAAPFLHELFFRNNLMREELRQLQARVASISADLDDVIEEQEKHHETK